MTEYEKELKTRVAEVDDKFILRGDIYVVEKEAELDSCVGCNFLRDGTRCNLTPDCDPHSVIYIKEVK